MTITLLLGVEAGASEPKGKGILKQMVHFLETKESPDSVSYQGLLNIKLDDDLLSHGISHTTIGDGAFHF